VDLPEPEAPTIASVSPLATSKLTSLSMVRRTSPVSICLDNPLARTIGAMESSFMLRFFLFLVFWFCGGASAQAASTVLVFGDSISSGYGLPQDAGWTHLLQRRLAQEKFDYRVVNASLTGETTVGGKSRISAVLEEHKPQIVILELGGND